MPSLDRDEEAFLVGSEVVPLAASPGNSGDFGKDPRMSSYGSTLSSNHEAPTAPVSPVASLIVTDQQPNKDPESWPLLGAVLPPPGGWARAAAAVPPGLSADDILPFVSDPFWRRLRTTLFALFWVVMAALLACVAILVANDPQPCSARTPPPLPGETVNVSLPLGALPGALQAVGSSRY